MEGEERARVVTIRLSHGGSGGQARTVIDGLNADVVTLALAGDIDEIAERSGKMPADWQKRLPHNSAPYTSTIVFLVRKGNPKGIKDWGDLAKPGVGVITPNPKTSGGARWNYLAAWAWAERQFEGDEAKMRDYIAALFRNVPVLDTGARGATTTFAQRGLGDVLLAWENEAFLALEGVRRRQVRNRRAVPLDPGRAAGGGGGGQCRAEGDARRGRGLSATSSTRRRRRRSPPRIITARPCRKRPMPQDLAQFPKLDLVTIDRHFGGWAKAQPEHFGEGGTFDQLYGKQ